VSRQVVNNPAAIKNVQKSAAINLINRYQIPCFYHFTDTRNISLIVQKGGLFSWSEIKDSGVIAPGGNDWSHDADAYKKMDLYVHLCFLDSHPMEYAARLDGRIKQSRFLKIKPEVIDWEGVLFTDDVSNKSGVNAFEIDEAINFLDFESIYSLLNGRRLPADKWKVISKYEILIPKHIPIRFIMDL
jgi:hypothetical protein